MNDKTLKLFRHFVDPQGKGKNPDVKNPTALMGPDGQLILGEHGIPASEIKLAKILMYKPAPHCSAQSWAIYDQKTN